MNSFIVSGKGFLEKVDFNEKYEMIFIWTNLLRNAKILTSKSAKKLIQDSKLDAFVWKPYEEEATRNKWEVVQRKEYNDFINEEKHNALEWYVRKVTLDSKTDIGFLNNKGIEIKEHFDSYEEASVIANERNLIMIKELENKLIKLVK